MQAGGHIFATQNTRHLKGLTSAHAALHNSPLRPVPPSPGSEPLRPVTAHYRKTFHCPDLSCRCATVSCQMPNPTLNPHHPPRPHTCPRTRAQSPLGSPETSRASMQRHRQTGACSQSRKPYTYLTGLTTGTSPECADGTALTLVNSSSESVRRGRAPVRT